MEKWKEQAVARVFAAFAMVWLACAWVMPVLAATLDLSSVSTRVSVGQTVRVAAYVSSPDRPINAVSGTIAFTEKTLEPVAVYRDGSVVSYWVNAPVLGGSGGTIDFEGVVLNPGFTGSNGYIFSIDFRAKADGDARAYFQNGSVLAHDGKGTEVLVSSAGIHVTIDPVEGPDPAEPVSNDPVPTVPAEEPKEEPIQPHSPGTPDAPVVTSSTHPDTGLEAWYANVDPTFEWELPAGATGVNVLADHVSDTNPPGGSDGIIRTISYDDVEDGQWYFHVKIRNADGWGEVAHIPFRIDTVPPDTFSMTRVVNDDAVDGGSAGFLFRSSDVTSGIAYYEVSIDDASYSRWIDDGTGIFRTDGIGAGLHVLHARAVDRAENKLEATSVGFEVGERPSFPVSAEVRRMVDGRSLIFVSGTTDRSGSLVNAWVSCAGKDPIHAITVTDGNGAFFVYIDPNASSETCKVWYEVPVRSGEGWMRSESVMTEDLGFQEWMSVNTRQQEKRNYGSVADVALATAAACYIVVRVTRNHRQKKKEASAPKKGSRVAARRSTGPRRPKRSDETS